MPITANLLPALAAVGLGLAACAGQPTVTGASLAAYSLSDRDHAATHGLRAEIVGNPFRSQEDEVRAVVGEVLVDHHFGPPFRRVVTDPDEPVPGPYRVLLAFQPGHGYANLCKGAPEPGPAGGRIEVHAAFCANEQLLTSTRGSVAGVDDPSDPAFRELMSMIAFELFPPFDEHTGGREFMTP